MDISNIYWWHLQSRNAILLRKIISLMAKYVYLKLFLKNWSFKMKHFVVFKSTLSSISLFDCLSISVIQWHERRFNQPFLQMLHRICACIPAVKFVSMDVQLGAEGQWPYDWFYLVWVQVMYVNNLFIELLGRLYF